MATDSRLAGGGVKLVLAAALAVGAIGAAVYMGLFRSTDTEVQTSAVAKLKCAKCGNEFEMPFAEYLAKAPQGADAAGGLTCPSCGEAAAMREQPTPIPMPAPDTALWEKEALTLDQIKEEIEEGKRPPEPPKASPG